MQSLIRTIRTNFSPPKKKTLTLDQIRSKQRKKKNILVKSKHEIRSRVDYIPVIEDREREEFERDSMMNKGKRDGIWVVYWTGL